MVTWLDGRMGDRITGREAIGCGGNCEEKRRRESTDHRARRQNSSSVSSSRSLRPRSRQESCADLVTRDKFLNANGLISFI